MDLSRFGLCPMVDEYGQYCVWQAGHRGPHESGSNSLKAWLEATPDTSIMRTYSGPSANQNFQAEARLFGMHGFFPVSQSGATVTGGPGAGRILAMGILAFGHRTSASTISVMFRKEEGTATTPTTASIPDQIRALGELRDAGLVTPEEFEAKKAELLSRM